MKKVMFRDPNGDESEITDLNMMRQDIIDDFATYWMQGSGDGFIEFFDEGKKIAMLMLGPNIEHGLYLHFIDCVKNKDLLSLYDESKLEEVAETAEEIYASVGLFLPKEEAWEGIKFFIETGRALSDIKWITPDDIPEEGNW